MIDLKTLSNQDLMRLALASDCGVKVALSKELQRRGLDACAEARSVVPVDREEMAGAVSPEEVAA